MKAYETVERCESITKKVVVKQVGNLTVNVWDTPQSIKMFKLWEHSGAEVSSWEFSKNVLYLNIVVDKQNYFTRCKAIAKAIQEMGCYNTTTGNWCFSFKELKRFFGQFVIDNLEDICGYFFGDVVADWEIYDNTLDITFYTNYCPYVAEDSEEE